MKLCLARCRSCDRTWEHVMAASIAMKTLDEARHFYSELRTGFRINPWGASDLLCGFCDRFFRYLEEDRRARQQAA